MAIADGGTVRDDDNASKEDICFYLAAWSIELDLVVLLPVQDVEC